MERDIKVARNMQRDLTFAAFCRAIESDAMAFGGDNAGALVACEPIKSARVLQAAALVFAARGEEFLLTHPEQFKTELISHLGIVARLSLTIVGLLFPGGAIWIQLIGLLLPHLIRWVQKRSEFAAADITDWAAISHEADRVVGDLELKYGETRHE